MRELRGQKIALTGATGGLGRALTRELGLAGAELVLIARDKDKLSELVASVAESGASATPMVMDLQDPAQIEAGCEELLRTAGRVDVLINNAAVGLYRDVADIELDQLRELFQVNVFAAIRLTQSVLADMRRRRDGTIVMISSVVGLRAMPRSAGYCMTKAALTSFCDSLRVELRDTGIHVLNVCPGLLDSEFFAQATPGAGRPRRIRPLPLEDAARRIVRALRARKRQVVFPASARFLHVLQRAAPRLVDRLLYRAYMK